MKRISPIFAFAFLFASSVNAIDAIVAADGSGDFRTVQEAINKSPQTSAPGAPWIILVKRGVYRERVYIQREKRGVRLVGEDAAATRIVFGLNANTTGADGKPLGTFRTATLQLDADDFTIENLTIENDAGNVGQALAIRIDGDRAVFRGCRFIGWQDTILVNRGRQYFENCHIAGAVDFIFGGATAWFENCDIFCTGKGYITAASTPREQPWGFVFSHCRITAANEDIRTCLGRPWRQYAATVFLNCAMSACVRPEGWDNWRDPARESTVRYAEYASTGAGADATSEKRVRWAKKLTPDDARAITTEAVLGGADGWHPAK